MFAVVETGSKQYKVETGQLLKVDRLKGEVNDVVNLEKVLMLSDDSGVKIGTPVVEGATVRATIVDQTKGKKIEVFKFKSKKRYRRHIGHRSHLTVLKIEEILPG